jgi:hypothetical protein
VRLDLFDERLRHAILLVSEHETDRPRGRPVVEINGIGGRFDRDDVVSGCRICGQRRSRCRVVLPGNGDLCAERRLEDRSLLLPALIRSRRDAAENEPLDCAGVRRPENAPAL